MVSGLIMSRHRVLPDVSPHSRTDRAAFEGVIAALPPREVESIDHRSSVVVSHQSLGQ